MSMQRTAVLAVPRPHFGPTDIRQRLAATAEIAGQALQELVIVLPGATAAALTRHLEAALAQLGAKGIRVRVLVTLPAGSRGPGRTGLRPTHFVEVRLTPTPVPEFVIVDGRTAFVGSAAEAAPTSDQAVIGSLYALFLSVWEMSSTASGPALAVRGLDGDVLAHLCDGNTDEVTARRLGISVRTYRRYVAKIMEDIGATSRFQAGVLASERGLV